MVGGRQRRCRTWLLNEFAVPPDTPLRHPVQNLYRLALTDLAVYLQCDFARPSLEASVRQAIELVESGEVMGFTTMTRSPCFAALMRQGQIPAPLINVTERNLRRDVGASRLPGDLVHIRILLPLERFQYLERLPQRIPEPVHLATAGAIRPLVRIRTVHGRGSLHAHAG